MALCLGQGGYFYGGKRKSQPIAPLFVHGLKSTRLTPLGTTHHCTYKERVHASRLWARRLPQAQGCNEDCSLRLPAGGPRRAQVAQALRRQVVLHLRNVGEEDVEDELRAVRHGRAIEHPRRARVQRLRQLAVDHPARTEAHDQGCAGGERAHLDLGGAARQEQVERVRHLQGDEEARLEHVPAEGKGARDKEVRWGRG
eukprot:scaffold22960_cov58-Phaeocystis_antarctica.AAC.6